MIKEIYPTKEDTIKGKKLEFFFKKAPGKKKFFMIRPCPAKDVLICFLGLSRSFFVNHAFFCRCLGKNESLLVFLVIVLLLKKLYMERFCCFVH